MTRDNGRPSQELATVTELRPASRTSQEVEPRGPVVDAEIVTDEEYAAAQRRRALERWDAVRRDVVTVTRATRTVVTHDKTKTSARFAARHGAYVMAGMVVLSKRLWDAKTNSFVNRMARRAEVKGDMEAAERWYTLGEQAKDRRHKRVMDWIQAPVDLLRSLLFGTVALLGFLLLLGAAVAAYTGDLSDVVTPIRGAIWGVATLVWLITVLAAFLPLIAVTGVVTVCWVAGRHAGHVPQWLAPARAHRGGDPITPSVVVTAFRDLGIAPLRKAIVEMGDAGAGMLSPIKVAGCGVEVDITLPSGVTVDEVLARRPKLAQNMGRHTHEVFPEVAPQPRTVRVWAADSGALDEPIGPSPMVLDEAFRADYKTGRAPWGQDLRTDPLGISLYQRHLLITGLSNQGKTRAMLSLALWLAHDPRVEFWLADLKGLAGEDWHVFEGIATEPYFIRGPTDDHVRQATEMLEAAVAEMNRRLQDGGSWDPLIVIVDEEQVAFMCPEKDVDGRPYGGTKATSRYFRAARAIHNQGRAVDVLLWDGVQDPTDQNLPKLVREGAHIRATTVLGTEEQARMALGDKAVNGGAAPHMLRPGLDKGVLVVAGDGAPLKPGQSSVTVRTHYVNDEEAQMLAQRVKARRRARTRIELERDLLTDVADCLDGQETVRAPDMAQRLRRLAPGYQPYQQLTGTDLAEELTRSYGVEVKKLKGYDQIRASRIFAAIDRREDERDEGE